MPTSDLSEKARDFIVNNIHLLSDGLNGTSAVIERNESRMNNAIYQFISSEMGVTADKYDKDSNDPRFFPIRDALNAEYGELLTSNIDVRRNFDQYYAACCARDGLELRSLDSGEVVLRTIIPSPSYGNPEQVFDKGLAPRLLNKAEQTPNIEFNRVYANIKDPKLLGYTSGVASTTVDAKHAVSQDFQPDREFAASWVYIIKPHGNLATVASSIHKGAGYTFGAESTNAEGAMEMTAAAIRPDEILGAVYINQLGECVELKINDNVPTAVDQINQLARTNLSLSMLLQSESAQDVQVAHKFYNQDHGLPYTQVRSGEKMKVDRAILGAQLPKKLGGAYDAGDANSVHNRKQIEKMRNLGERNEGLYDPIARFDKEKKPDKQTWEQEKRMRQQLDVEPPKQRTWVDVVRGKPEAMEQENIKNSHEHGTRELAVIGKKAQMHASRDSSQEDRASRKRTHVDRIKKNEYQSKSRRTI